MRGQQLPGRIVRLSPGDLRIRVFLNNEGVNEASFTLKDAPGFYVSNIASAQMAAPFVNPDSKVTTERVENGLRIRVSNPVIGLWAAAPPQFTLTDFKGNSVGVTVAVSQIWLDEAVDHKASQLRNVAELMQHAQQEVRSARQRVMLGDDFDPVELEFWMKRISEAVDIHRQDHAREDFVRLDTRHPDWLGT